MQLAPATPTLDLTALREVSSAHDAGYKVKQLERRRAHFAHLYARYHDMLALTDEGYEVSITLRSATKQITLSHNESERGFDITELYDLLGKQMDAIQAEILDLLSEQASDPHGCFAGTNEPLLHQAIALCMPQPTSENLPGSPAPTTPAAKAA